MRKIDIRLEQTKYSPGSSIQGEVVVKTDKEFEANRVTLEFVGVEEARVVRGAGDSRRVYREKIFHIDEETILHEGVIIPEGTTSFPFEVNIPRNLPGSYYGHYGSIRYQLRAKVEISWALDPKCEVDIGIIHPLEHVPPKPFTKFIDWNGLDQIQIEIPRHTIAPPEPFPIRILLRGDPKIRGIRFEILFKEIVAPKGRTETTTRQLSTAYLKSDDLTYNSWMDINIETSERWPLPFSSQLIKTTYVLKVTADIRLRFDRSVEFRLVPSCPPADLFEHEDFSW
ncbi:MAG: sporulation protein [Candidatus Thorarchaeota archaeon]